MKRRKSIECIQCYVNDVTLMIKIIRHKDSEYPYEKESNISLVDGCSRPANYCSVTKNLAQFSSEEEDECDIVSCYLLLRFAVSRICLLCPRLGFIKYTVAVCVDRPP